MRKLSLLFVISIFTIPLKAEFIGDTMRHIPFQLELLRIGNILCSDDHGGGITVGGEGRHFFNPYLSINFGYHIVLFKGSDGISGGNFVSIKPEIFSSSNDKSRFFIGAGISYAFEKFPDFGFVTRGGYQFSSMRIGAEFFIPQFGDRYIQRNHFYTFFISYTIRRKK